MTVAEFAASIKAKHPEYRSIPDVELTQKVLVKYPQYRKQLMGVVDDGGGDTTNGQDTSEPDTWWGGVGKSLKDQAGELVNKLGVGNPLTRATAQPQSIGDFLNLIIPEMSGGIAATAHTAAEPLVSTGEMVERAGRAARPAASLGVTEAILKGGQYGMDPKGLAVAAAPYAVEGGGRILQKVGAALRKVPTVAGQVVEDTSLPAGVQERAFRDATPAIDAAQSTQAPQSFMEQKGLPPAQDELANQLQNLGQQNAPESVDIYSSPEAPAEVPAETERTSGEPSDNEMGGDPTSDLVSEVMGQNGMMPLGKPRVIQWKSGAGPTDDLIQQLRAAEGSKATASRLKIPLSQVKARAPQMSPASLPPEATNRITTAMQGITPEQQAQYLADAPNDLVRMLIQNNLTPK